MSESLSSNILTQNNLQAYEANQNGPAPLNLIYNDKENVQTQLNNIQNKPSSVPSSIKNDIPVQEKNIADDQNMRIVDEQQKETINSASNSKEKNIIINVEPSKSDSDLNLTKSSENFENNNSQNSQEKLSPHIEEQNHSEEQKTLVNLEDQIHPINTPIEEIYGVDRNFRNDLIFTVRFKGYNKIERITNQDMKKYHQQELIAFYEKCMIFCQPKDDMPPYKPR
ncbi:hypothetical protein M9Y10_002377 [Tritrichomonas musculus]|uniref:Chromo domain-containing protein n=1 Tax=Tritrichomonas musculus TaxID=1915356 RepID=A0ABR2L9L2_9EUKA